MNDSNRRPHLSSFDAADDFDELDHLGSAPDEPGDLQSDARRRSEDGVFRALYDVAVRLTSRLELAPLLEEVLDSALEVLGGGRGVIFLGEGDPGQLVPMVRRSVGTTDLAEIEQLSQTILNAASQESGVYSPDVTSDQRFQDAESVRSKTVRSVLCRPMISRGRTIGLIYVDRSTAGGYGTSARQFFEAFVSLAGLAIENARSHEEMRRENVRIRERLSVRDAFGRIIGPSLEMTRLIDRAKVVAAVEEPVMLLGESGTGKELFARAIHESSQRALQPFVAYNCAAVPPELMESLFFGHRKGAFSGAFHDSAGLFRKADKGILFLDEVADLSHELQGKLLRVLQENTMWPIGADEEVTVDVRILAATSKDLAQEVRSGRFREDLLYRLCVLELRIPPLRERTEDIPALVQHFVRSESSVRGAHIEFKPDALTFLRNLPWRGNVRELENVIRRALVLRQGDVIDLDEIRSCLSDWSLPEGTQDEEAAGATERSDGSRAIPEGVESSASALSLDEAERRAVVAALEEAEGNKTQAARVLGIHRNSLVRRMQRFGIR